VEISGVRAGFSVRFARFIPKQKLQNTCSVESRKISSYNQDQYQKFTGPLFGLALDDHFLPAKKVQLHPCSVHG
jgi:hypothetical protein